MFILDNYSESGTDYLQFVDAVNAMANRTEVLQLPLNVLRVYTLVAEDDEFFYLTPNTGFSPTYDLTTGTLSSHTMKIKKFSKEKIMSRKLCEAFLKEVSASRTIIVMDNKETWFIGAGIFDTFGQRLDLTGRHMDKPTFARNEHIQEVLNGEPDKQPEKVVAVLRQQNGVKKAFAVHSNSYPYVPQTILCDIADRFLFANYNGLGEAKCDGWEVNHHFSTVKLLFPEKAKDLQATYGLPDEIIPGLILTTSDLGKYSITAKGFFYVRGSTVIQKEIKQQHKGIVKTDDVIKNVDMGIFSEYTKLPARLCELMTIDVADVKYALGEAFTGLDIRTFGEKTTEKLNDALMSELPSGGHYTAYDLSMTILSLRGRLTDIPVYTRRILEEKCIKAPFLQWEQFASLTDGSVVVTA